MSPVYIGTSGWSYKGWEKTFYPRDVPVSPPFRGKDPCPGRRRGPGPGDPTREQTGHYRDVPGKPHASSCLRGTSGSSRHREKLSDK